MQSLYLTVDIEGQTERMRKGRRKKECGREGGIEEGRKRKEIKKRRKKARESQF